MDCPNASSLGFDGDYVYKLCSNHVQVEIKIVRS